MAPRLTQCTCLLVVLFFLVLTNLNLVLVTGQQYPFKNYEPLFREDLAGKNRTYGGAAYQAPAQYPASPYGGRILPHSHLVLYNDGILGGFQNAEYEKEIQLNYNAAATNPLLQSGFSLEPLMLFQQSYIPPPHSYHFG